MPAGDLDQFFTKPATASRCWQSLVPILQQLAGKNADECFYVEPSAGDGAFYDLLPQERRIGIDIAPRRADFVRCDFLEWQPSLPPNVLAADVVAIGNPPFGHRGDLAKRFIIKAAMFADTMAFIVPVIFRRYHMHRRLPAGLRLVHAEPLPRNAFETPNGKTRLIGAEFQIWTRFDGMPDRRLFARPPTAHRDFKMWQYNNTRASLKVFANDFAFAVPCQGWQDYNRRETLADSCEKHKQWILFKPANPAAHRRLHDGLDYAALSQQNATTTPGFRKHDIVREYTRLYG